MQYKLKKNLPSLDIGTLFTRGNSPMHGDYLMNSNDGFTIIMYLKNIKNFDEWFEKVKWEPGYNVKFFYFNLKFELKSTVWNDAEVDCVHYEAGNCFKTEQDCQEKINQIKEILK